MKLQARIGLFFLIVGIFSLIVFSAYVRKGAPGGVRFFLAGITSIAMGWFMWDRYREKAPPSRLFRMFRKKKKDKGHEEKEGTS